MDKDKKSVEKFEEDYKNEFLETIRKVGSRQLEEINQIKTNSIYLGQLQVNIPDASKTLNDKIEELSNIFRKSGLFMFSDELENYDMVSSSFLGKAIIHDLIDKFSEANIKLEKYGKKMRGLSNQKSEQLSALLNVSPLKKILSRIRAFFVPEQPVDLSLTEEEKETLDSLLQEYKDTNSEIMNYNLEDNIVQALVKEIAGLVEFRDYNISHRYSASAVPGLLKESVIPYLKKLGLEHLVPKLQEALVEEYKKDLSKEKTGTTEDRNKTIRKEEEYTK